MKLFRRSNSRLKKEEIEKAKKAEVALLEIPIIKWQMVKLLLDDLGVEVPFPTTAEQLTYIYKQALIRRNKKSNGLRIRKISEG